MIYPWYWWLHQENKLKNRQNFSKAICIQTKIGMSFGMPLKRMICIVFKQMHVVTKPIGDSRGLPKGKGIFFTSKEASGTLCTPAGCNTCSTEVTGEFYLWLGCKPCKAQKKYKLRRGFFVLCHWDIIFIACVLFKISILCMSTQK